MSEDPIRDLLRQADADAGRPSVQADRAGRVFRQARRRKVAGIVGWAAAASIVLAIGASAAFWKATARDGNARATDIADGESERQGPKATRTHPPRPSARAQTEVDRLRDEIAQLRAEADFRMVVVNRMLALERKRRHLATSRRELMMPDPTDAIDQQTEKAALVMVYQADRMARLDLQEPAVDLYRRAIELFPETHWAEVARQKLLN